MSFLLFFIFLALSLSLVLSFVKRGGAVKGARIFRFASVLAATAFFTHWFFRESVTPVVQNAMGLQLINQLPQPVDFYIIKKGRGSAPDQTMHPGKIRPEHFRIAYLSMQDSDEFWIAGYIGKKNMVYFSQHLVPNKNMDQIVETRNYIIQSQKLAAQAKRAVEAYSVSNISTGVWVTLALLLLFMNTILLLQRK